MKRTLKNLIFKIFTLIILFSSTIYFNVEKVSALESASSSLIKKVSKDYTKKFCNAIGFGLSKESAMSFSMEENKKVFIKRKGINDIDKELLAEEIAISVIENCGYPINLVGEEGIKEFKSYYISKIN